MFIGAGILAFYPVQTKAQEIILIRHARVNIDAKGWMGPKRAEICRSSYDTAQIAEFNPDPVLSLIGKRLTDTVYTSCLPRAIATAGKLFGDSASCIPDSLFNEFGLPIARLPLILPFRGWTSISRAAWLVKHSSRDGESFPLAKKRVDEAVSFIEEKAAQTGQVIVVGHGFFNHSLKNHLKKEGWKKVYDKGEKNLGMIILRK